MNVLTLSGPRAITRGMERKTPGAKVLQFPVAATKKRRKATAEVDSRHGKVRELDPSTFDQVMEEFREHEHAQRLLRWYESLPPDDEDEQWAFEDDLLTFFDKEGYYPDE